MKKTLLITALCFSLNAMAGVPLLDLIVKGGKELVDFGTKKGLKAAEHESLSLAFGALTKKSGIYTAKDLNAALDSIKPSGEYIDDVAKINSIRKTLAKSSDDISDTEMKKLVDDVAIIGNRYGDRRGITCGGSCDGEVGSVRYKEASSLVKKFTTSKRMSSNPVEVRKSIQDMANKLKVGNLADATTEEALPKNDEELVHIILDMALNGTKDEKAFAKSVLNFSKRNGKTNLFDADFPNHLYRVLTDKDLASKMTKYTEFFNKVNSEITDDLPAHDKLKAYMSKVVDSMDSNNPEKAKLKEAYEDFINANCFK